MSCIGYVVFAGGVYNTVSDADLRAFFHMQCTDDAMVNLNKRLRRIYDQARPMRVLWLTVLRQR